MKLGSQPAFLLALASLSALAQGTFVFDQQSSTDETPFPGGMQVPAFPGLGDGQSFTPGFTSVGFMRLLFTGNGGGTFYVNLRSNSMVGTIIGTSETLAFQFAGPRTFQFSTPVSVTPGTVYYFEAVQSTGTACYLAVGQYNYPGGTAFSAGSPNYPQDFWFREGIIVPEPSSAVTMLLGGTAILLLRYRNRE